MFNQRTQTTANSGRYRVTERFPDPLRHKRFVLELADMRACTADPTVAEKYKKLLKKALTNSLKSVSL